jgi:catechol 2,3-dioxygenase-like lactoylglutathione lyase family enzyme
VAGTVGGGVRFGAMSGFGHIDLRVADADAALPFYEALMPELGYTLRFHGAEWKVWARTDAALPATQYVGFTETAGHVANENRIAFWVESRDEVDRIAALVVATPREMPYGPGYYAIFFADPSGNLLEVYHRPA